MYVVGPYPAFFVCLPLLVRSLACHGLAVTRGTAKMRMMCVCSNAEPMTSTETFYLGTFMVSLT